MIDLVYKSMTIPQKERKKNGRKRKDKGRPATHEMQVNNTIASRSMITQPHRMPDRNGHTNQIIVE